tara:strand:+ start:7982 stop:8188 length:207 start_codon:yes stop_codon:yes gene_type:complete
MGDYRNAMKNYNKSINLYPYDHEYYLSRAGLYNFLGKNKSAIRDMNKAIKINPKNADYFYKDIANNMI